MNLRKLVKCIRPLAIMVMLFVLICQLLACVQKPPLNMDEVLNEDNSTHLELDAVIGGRRLSLELALTEEERARGLMNRPFLPDDRGMLFIFPDADPYPTELQFWMKDCLIPIDLIFVSRDGKIVSIHEMEPPPPGTPDQELPLYRSGGPAQFAIELSGGFAAEIGLQAGDRLDLPWDSLVKLAE